MSWRSPEAAAAALAVAAALARLRCALAPARRRGVTLVPPKPNVFLGVSDRGTTAEFNEFAALAGKHPALLQTFHPWGNSLNEAYERWRETGTRPILHISTADDQTLAEMITPAADRARRRRRLPAAAQRLLRQTRPARLHPAARRAEPLPQPLVGGLLRRHARKAANTRPAGTSRPSAGSPRSCAAGRRWKGINATLAEIGLPPLNRTKGPNPDRPAGGAGEHHLEPAARRLAAGQGQLPGQLLAGQPLGRLGRHRLLLAVSGLEGPQPLLQRQAVAGKPIAIAEWAVHRRRRTALRQAADRLGREAAAGADARLLPRLRRDRQRVRARPLPADDEHPAPEDPPRQLPLDTPTTTPAPCRRCRRRRKPENRPDVRPQHRRRRDRYRPRPNETPPARRATAEKARHSPGLSESALACVAASIRLGGVAYIIPPMSGMPPGHAAAGAVLLRRLGDDRLGDEDVLGDRRRVLAAPSG